MHLHEAGIAIYSCEVFQCYAFPQCHNICMSKPFMAITIFRGILLNWLTKSSRFEEGFNDNKLL